MFLTGHHIDRNSADGVPETANVLSELLQYGDEGVTPYLERMAIWAQESGEQGQVHEIIE
jgi:hypothetical protein